MYYPKSQIETNLYSNGELLVETTKLPYNGYYFSTYDGKFFSGKEPNDGPNFTLIRASKSNINNDNFAEYLFDPNPELQDLRFEGGNAIYSNIIKADKNLTLYSPVSYHPIITAKDIANGEFSRYFVKKSNENVYTEVDKRNYNLAMGQKLYQRLSFLWVIVGDQNEVATRNRNQLIFQEKTYKITGLGAFLNFNYLEFYQG